MSFDSLGLVPALLSSIERTGFTTPTPVQMSAIPAALAGAGLAAVVLTGAAVAAGVAIASAVGSPKKPSCDIVLGAAAAAVVGVIGMGFIGSMIII